jgi:hypothetical protein
VNLLKGLENRISEAHFALDAEFTSLSGFGGIKSVARESIRESCDCSPTIHFCLGAFGFEFVQDASEDGNLPLVQVEFVGQKSQRPANTKTAATTIAALETLFRALPGWAA